MRLGDLQPTVVQIEHAPCIMIQWTFPDASGVTIHCCITGMKELYFTSGGTDSVSLTPANLLNMLDMAQSGLAPHG